MVYEVGFIGTLCTRVKCLGRGKHTLQMKPAVSINPRGPLLHQLSHLLKGRGTSLCTESPISATCWWPAAPTSLVPKELCTGKNNSHLLLKARALEPHHQLQHFISERTQAGNFFKFIFYFIFFAMEAEGGSTPSCPPGSLVHRSFLHHTHPTRTSPCQCFSCIASRTSLPAITRKDGTVFMCHAVNNSS